MNDDFTDWAAAAEVPLLRSAYLLTGDLHRAEDLVQEAMVKVALRWRRLSGERPTAYARRVIARDHVSWWRKRGREVPVAEISDAQQVSSDPEAVLVVRKALARLTPSQRAVLVLRHFDDLSERETADLLGVSIGTVKSQNAAALTRLRTGAPELLDLIGPLGLGSSAVEQARRQRTQQKVVGGAAVAIVLVVLIGVLVVRGGDADGDPQPIAPTTGVPTMPQARSSLDPGKARDLPDASSEIAPMLPDRIDPPATAMPLADAPVERAVFATDRRPGYDAAGVVLLLSDNGDWRSIPVGAGQAWSLSPEGAKVVVWRAQSTKVIFDLHDVASGRVETVTYDGPFLTDYASDPDWVSGHELMLHQYGADHHLVIDVDTGQAEPAPFNKDTARGAGPVELAITMGGEVIEGRPNADSGAADPEFVDWASGRPRPIERSDISRPSSLVADENLVAGTGQYQRRQGGGLFVLDRNDFELQASLDIPDIWENGMPAEVIGFADDGVVLFVVGLPPATNTQKHVFAWDPYSGAISTVSVLSQGGYFAELALR